MKNVFGSCNGNEHFDGAKFIIRNVNPIIEEEINNILQKNENFQEKASLPKVLKILKYVFGFGGFIIAAGIIKSLGDISIKEAFNNAAFLFYTAGISILIWAILVIYEKNKSEDVAQSQEVKDLEVQSNDLLKKALDDLKIPEDAKLVDVLSYHYKLHDGKEKQLNGFFKYINMQLRLYVEDDKLHLGDAHELYAIPLSYIKKISIINKKISVFGWNKDAAYNSKEYKQYKITANNYGVLFFKNYCSILINDGIEEFEIMVPTYEKDVIKELTNISIEEVSE